MEPQSLGIVLLEVKLFSRMPIIIEIQYLLHQNMKILLGCLLSGHNYAKNATGFIHKYFYYSFSEVQEHQEGNDLGHSIYLSKLKQKKKIQI